MKKILAVLAILLATAIPLFAGTIPMSGTIRLANGNLFTGSVRFILSYSAAQDFNAGNIVVASTVQYAVNNGVLPSNAKITPNDTLSPANTWYTAQYISSTGALVAQNTFYIAGQSFNLGTATPTPVTTSNISFNDFNNLDDITAKVINAVRYCKQFPGTTMDAKFAAAAADLPSTGGTVDCQSMQGPQVWSGSITVTKPVTVLLGAATISCSVNSSTGCLNLSAAGSSIVGIGPQATVFVMTGLVGALSNFSATNGHIAHMTFRGACVLTTGCTNYIPEAVALLNGGAADNVTIDDVVFENSPTYGVNIGGNTSNWKIIAPTAFKNIAGDCLFLPGNGSNVVSGVTFTNCGANAIDINSIKNRIVHNTLVNSGYNFMVTGVDANGIVLSANIGPVDNNVISDNVITTTAGAAVRIRGDYDIVGMTPSHANKNIVHNNTIDAAQIGVMIDTSIGSMCGEASNNEIHDNTIINSTAQDVLIGGGAGTPCITNGNYIHHNNLLSTTAGYNVLAVWGTGNVIDSNTATGAMTANIFTTGSNKTLVTGNKTSNGQQTWNVDVGSLLTNTIGPVSGPTITESAAGNTSLTLHSTSGGSYRDYELVTLSDGTFALFDATSSADRVIVGTSAVRVLEDTFQVESAGNTAINLTTTVGGGGAVNYAMFIDGSNYFIYDLTNMAIRLRVNASGITFNEGANIVYRCATAGSVLPAGSLTVNAAACGTTADTTLRVP